MSEPKINRTEETEEEVNWLDKCNVLYDFLLGHRLPKGFVGVKMPNLSPQKAFAVIYILQEAIGVLPDSIEQCSSCGNLFDSDNAGTYGGDDSDVERKKKYHGKLFCDDCIPEDLYKQEEPE